MEEDQNDYNMTSSSSEYNLEAELMKRKALLFNISLDICITIYEQIIGKHNSGGIVYIDMPDSNSSSSAEDELIDMDEHEYNEVFDVIKTLLADFEGLKIVPWNIFIVFTVLYAIVILFGLFSNATIVATFYNCKKLRTFRNAYIVNLAISDILFCAVCAPIILFRYTTLNWHFGQVLCKASSSLQTANVLVSVFSMASIAIDRWQFIVHSSSPSASSSSSSYTSATSGVEPIAGSPKRLSLALSIAFIWILAFLVSAPLVFVRAERVLKFRPTDELIYATCEEYWSDINFKFFYCFVLFFFKFILPAFIIALSNYQICRYLHFKIPIIYRSSENRSSEKPISYSNELLEDSERMVGDSSARKSVIIRGKSISRDEEEGPSTCWEGLFRSSKPNGVGGAGSSGGSVSGNGNGNGNGTNYRRYTRQSTSVVHRRSRSNNSRYSKSRRILFFVFVSFSLCWLPSTLYNLFIDYYYADTRSAGGRRISLDVIVTLLVLHLIAISSTCLNPILYGLLNRNFNQELSNLFFTRRATNTTTLNGVGYTTAAAGQAANGAEQTGRGGICIGGCNAAKTTGDSLILTDRNMSTRKNSPNPLMPLESSTPTV